jgi:hypothetical protein
VLLLGSPATYANRAFLKGLGLRWDPEGHRWHGTASAENVRALREQLGLEVRCFGSLDVPPAPIPPAEVVPTPGARPVSPPTPTVVLVRDPSPRRAHDGSRTRFESRLAFGGVEEDDSEEIVTPSRQFTIRETTSGLPDDSREADERAEERRLYDLRGRVKAARAVVSTTPGLADTLQSDWVRAARFYARWGITERLFQHGCPPTCDAPEGYDVAGSETDSVPSRLRHSVASFNYLDSP